MLIIRAGIQKTIIKITNMGDPDETASSRYALFPDIFDWQIVLEILELLPSL